jgi:hypothetical protein
MMICATYAKCFEFPLSQATGETAETTLNCHEMQLAQVESTFQKKKELSNKQTNNDNGNVNSNRKNKPMCWKTGGKDNCLWKNLGDEEAKAKTLEWVASKQAQIKN